MKTRRARRGKYCPGLNFRCDGEQTVLGWPCDDAFAPKAVVFPGTAEAERPMSFTGIARIGAGGWSRPSVADQELPAISRLRPPAGGVRSWIRSAQ